MNIRCPHCQTVFRVNPDRIPPSGVRAKCARCGETFLVTPPAAAGAAPPASPVRAASEGPAVGGGTSTAPPRAAAVSSPARPSPASPPPPSPDRIAEEPPAVTPPPAVDPVASPSPAGATAATAPAAQTSGAPSFGTRDPRARAERLARALVSDIVAYHPERRDRSLTNGTLRTEFREEIMKSWEEYVAQVGLEVAKSTPFFRDALNAILARGQKLF